MWLIAETVTGIFLEYWEQVDKNSSRFVISMSTEANAAEDLDVVKAALNKYKVKPPEHGV